MRKGILKEIFKGILPALPFGNVLKEINNNINEDGYTAKGEINWPKLVMYIITGLIVTARLFGFITNEDVNTLISTLTKI